MIKLIYFILISTLLIGCKDLSSEKKEIQYKEYSSKVLAFPDSMAYFKKDMTPFSGIAVDSSDTELCIISRKQYLNGYKHGRHKYYYCFGNLLASEINYKNGLRHGESKMWDIDGQLRAREKFTNGILKESFYWDANGKKTNEYDLEDYFVIEDFEIKDVVAESNNQPRRSAAPTLSHKPKPPNPNTSNNTSSEELTDNKPDESVSNPFASNNGGFSGSFNGQGSEGGSSAPGNGDGPSGQGFGGPQRENNPIPPEYDTDYSGNVCVELLINAQGKAISAKSCNSTSHPDQNVVKSVIEYIKKNVKYKAEPGAGNRKAFYTVYVQAN